MHSSCNRCVHITLLYITIYIPYVFNKTLQSIMQKNNKSCVLSFQKIIMLQYFCTNILFDTIKQHLILQLSWSLNHIKSYFVFNKECLGHIPHVLPGHLDLFSILHARGDVTLITKSYLDQCWNIYFYRLFYIEGCYRHYKWWM